VVVLCAVLAVRRGLGDDVRQRYVGVVRMLLGIVVLLIAMMVCSQADGPRPLFFTWGVVASVCLGWWGYRARRRRPPDPFAEVLLSLPTAPAASARTVEPAEVLGAWRFYVDAAASTVTIDLHGDGRYTQVIVGNGGERTECPGGAWTLDGPFVALTSYRSAAREVIQGVRWFFDEWEKELVLFAKDDPRGETTLLGLRAAAVPIT
jgi:hypothetical protein